MKFPRLVIALRAPIVVCEYPSSLFCPSESQLSPSPRLIRTALLVALLLALAQAGWAEDSTDGSESARAKTEANRESEASSDAPPRRSSSPPPPVGVRLSEALDGGQMRVRYSFERRWFREIDVDGADRQQGEIVNGLPGSYGLSNGYLQAPTALEVTIHTVQIAYAPHPRVTLVAEVPFLEKKLQRFGASFGRNSANTSGIGNVSFSVIVPFIKKGRESSQIHIGVSAPTGAIRRGGDARRLPYDNQIGNGTWDLEWGWTYRGERDAFSWGAQLYGHHPVGSNGLHYRQGSRFNASIWTGLNLVGGLSGSLRLIAEKQNNIRGRDRSLNLAQDGPSSNDKARGGIRVAVSPGLSLEIPQLNHQRISVEFGIPVFQNLDGPQLKRDWSLKAGWQWVF